MILSVSDLDLACLFRLTRINKEWRSLIHDTSEEFVLASL
jgi:hypothetical protein